MSNKNKILIVDDEKELIALVSLHINMAGYEVLFAYDGEEALEIVNKEKPDLIILDLMLPKIDGWQVCQLLRKNPKTSNIAVIMLTCRAEIEDKLKGFESGADDYITKPFSPRELVARVKRVLARLKPKLEKPNRYNFGGFEVSLDDFKVKVKGKEIHLTDKEREILEMFANRPGELLTHDEILDTVWGKESSVEYGNIDVHIRHLREKIEDDPVNPRIIKTIKGEGYKFEI